MSEEPDNIVLVMLRRIDAKLDRVGEDVHNLKVRMTSVEEGMAAMNRRVDRIEERLDRIERRLDLTEVR
jgi:predicted  nucleic acid-binding Zn-ribbon protein